MLLLDRTIPELGMGCWPIGGKMTAGGASVGYTQVDDQESLRTLDAAYDTGIRLYDTAAAYGAGHSETLLGQAFAQKPDAMIVTKVGIEINETTKELTGAETNPKALALAIDDCLRRLKRDCIDVVMLHNNALPMTEAEPIFDMMDQAVQAGKIRGYGWSTDFSPFARAFAPRANFVAVEHASNVVMDTPKMVSAIQETGLAALIRSPLGMGVLTGKFTPDREMPKEDIRGSGQEWNGYFTQDGRANPDMLQSLDAVRDLLQTGGRSLPQGAIAWLWARSDRNIPIPGARTFEQITDTAGALEHGPLPAAVMAEIETLLPRDPDAPERER